MQPLQREHIRTVIEVADDRLPSRGALKHDELIRASWQRCVHEHRLDPTRMQEAVILPQSRLREHQDRIEDFLHIARHGLETLYQQVAGMGYCVLLTDARGITVDFIGDLTIDHSLRRAGLYLGADWSEHSAGTCGVGTAIATGQALTVHLDDHFDATHIPLTCTTAPVFDPLGELTAILDISALNSPQPKASQHLALQLVKAYAAHIENASFMQRFRREWILKLNEAPEFLDLNPRYLLAVNAGGHVIGHNRRAQLLLEGEPGMNGARLLGQPFERLFNARFDELGRFVQFRPTEQRALMLAGSGRVLFMQASAPPSGIVPQRLVEATERKLPPALAALSGGDPVLERQIERAARLVNSPVSVLLTGETGTGKEYFAKALHQASERRSRPFVAVNCAAIPEALIESELFGHLPGSFSGAGAKGKRGLIQEADSGTLFLDEIGDMPRDLQARLLRVLAEREVLPIGATRPVAVNIRVIAATHCALEALVREGRFRDDLYYRLNGAHLTLPPLRERRDLAWLMQRMLSAPMGDVAPAQLAPAVTELLHAHRWPGNLRELRNVIEFARTVCAGGVIELCDLPDSLLREAGADGGGPHGADELSRAALRSGDGLANNATRGSGASAAALDADEPHVGARGADGACAVPGVSDEWRSTPRAADDASDAALLLQYLRSARWNVSAVARQLGVSRMTLYRRMKRWAIQSPNRQQGEGPGAAT